MRRFNIFSYLEHGFSGCPLALSRNKSNLTQWLRSLAYPLFLSLALCSCQKNPLMHPTGQGGSGDTILQRESRIFFDTCHIRFLVGEYNISAICMEIREQLGVNVDYGLIRYYSEESFFNLDCELCLLRELILQMKRREPAIEFFFYGYHIQVMFLYRPTNLLPDKE